MVQITTRSGTVVTVATNTDGAYDGYLCPRDGHVKANACGVCGKKPSDRCVRLDSAYMGAPDMPICYGCLPEILLLDEVVNG